MYTDSRFYYLSDYFSILPLPYQELFPDITIPSLVVVKPKKSRYAIYEKNMSSIEEIKAFVDEVTGGFV